MTRRGGAWLPLTRHQAGGSAALRQRVAAAQPLDLAPRIAPRPVLLIWAPNGGNRKTLNPIYQRLIGTSVSIWSMSDVKHIKGLTTHPDAYERRVIAFFDAALLDDPEG